MLIYLQACWGVRFAISFCLSHSWGCTFVPSAYGSCSEYICTAMGLLPNSSSHLLDRLDTKPVLQKTQHPSHCTTGWAPVTLVPGCYFLDGQGATKWALPPRPFHFQHPFIQKAGSRQVKINASRAQSLPVTSGPNPAKHWYFLWRVECSCALLSFFWQLGQPQQSCFPYREKGTSSTYLLRSYNFGSEFFFNRCTNFLPQLL